MDPTHTHLSHLLARPPHSMKLEPADDRIEIATAPHTPWLVWLSLWPILGSQLIVGSWGWPSMVLLMVISLSIGLLVAWRRMAAQRLESTGEPRDKLVIDADVLHFKQQQVPLSSIEQITFKTARIELQTQQGNIELLVPNQPRDATKWLASVIHGAARVSEQRTAREIPA